MIADKVKDVEDEENIRSLGRKKGKKREMDKMKKKLKRCRRSRKKSFHKGQLDAISLLIEQLEVIKKKKQDEDGDSSS